MHNRLLQPDKADISRASMLGFVSIRQMTKFRIAKAHKVRIFAQEYAKDQNGSRAYVAAGYSRNGADAGAARLLAEPGVRAQVRKVLDKKVRKVGLSAEETLRQIKLCAFSNMLDYITIDPETGEPHLDLAKTPHELGAAIREISFEEVRRGAGARPRLWRFGIKLVSKCTALRMALEYHVRLAANSPLGADGSLAVAIEKRHKSIGRED